MDGEWYNATIKNPDAIDSEVLEDIANRLNMDSSSDKFMSHIKTMTAFEVVDAYMSWNGLFGFTDGVVSAVLSTQDATFGDE